MSNNILEPIPPNLNDYLLKYNATTLSDTTPEALDGATNVTWQMDGFGNISACVAGGGGGSSVGTAGQVQMVGNTAGSFAASQITDNGTTVQIGATTIPSLLIGNTGTLGSIRTHASTSVNDDPTYILLDNGNGTEYAFASVAVNLPAGSISLAGWYGGMAIQGNVNIGTTTPLLGINARDQASGQFGVGQNMFSVLASKQVTTWNNTLDDGTGKLTAVNLAVSGATTATSATAGAATVLPVAPLGYLEIGVNGVTVKVPYYTV